MKYNYFDMCTERAFKNGVGVYDIDSVTLINYFCEPTERLSFYTKNKKHPSRYCLI